MGILAWIVGIIMLIAGIVFSIPAFIVKPITAPNESTKLKTTGFYALVRHPIYLGEILWTLGWAILFGSIIGVLLVPVWWIGLLFHIVIEEECLERTLGQPYLEYKKKVRGRIIPGLPI